jgi:hypothetical protein
MLDASKKKNPEIEKRIRETGRDLEKDREREDRNIVGID